MSSAFVDLYVPRYYILLNMLIPGLAAAECFWIELKSPKLKGAKLQIIEKIARIALIWFCVYLVIAIPCWCQRGTVIDSYQFITLLKLFNFLGWCCCCFRCKFCKPRQRIDEAKHFLMNNPAGVYHINDEKVTYTPSNYEEYAQKKLQHVLMKL